MSAPPAGEAWICATCGAHHPDAPAPPEACRICRDERQYEPEGGPRWLRPEELEDRAPRVEEVEPGIHGIGLEPPVAIGQRALLVRTPEGNLLWDCLPWHEGLRERVEALGGVRAVAVSHPHYYAAMADWAEAFDAPVLLHAADREHVTRPSPRHRFWEGERLEPFGGLTLIRAGGHFAGGTVLHVPDAAEGRGALLTGDIVQVIPDRRWVGFLYSYPNLIPLPAREVRRVAAAVEPFAFDRIHGAWWGTVIRTGAGSAVQRSADRYVRALEGRLDGAELPWPGSEGPEGDDTRAP